MFYPLLVVFIAVATAAPKIQPNLQSLWNFEEVTECVLHYRALVYNNYGCWCGIGGAHEPVDDIDRCCMIHDKCYDAAVDNKVCYDVPWEYVDNYKWRCNNSTATCEDHQDACKTTLCKCDTAVVNCWGRFPRPNEKAKCNHTKFMYRKNKMKNSKYFQH